MKTEKEEKVIVNDKEKKHSDVLIQIVLEIILIGSTIAILAAAGFPGGVKLLALIFGGYAVRIILAVAFRISKGRFSKSNRLFTVI